MRPMESEVVGGLFWMGVGFFFLSELKLNIGTLRNPGPGFLPKVMASILVLFSLFAFVKGLIRPLKPLREFPWRRPALAITSVFIFGLLLDFVGFLLSTFMLMFFLFSLLRSKGNWAEVFILAAATSLVSWFVFSVALSVPFPSPRLIAIWR